MNYITVYEMPEDTYLWEEFGLNLAFVLAAALYLSYCVYSIIKKRRLKLDAIFISAVLILLGACGCGTLADFARDGIQNPYAKAYYEGRYEIAEGMPEEIQTTKLGTSIYVDGEEYYYDGGKVVMHGEKVKLYYVDDDDGGNYVVRIDAYRAVPYSPE